MALALVAAHRSGVGKSSFLELLAHGTLVTAAAVHEPTCGLTLYVPSPIPLRLPLRPVRFRMWDIYQAYPRSLLTTPSTLRHMLESCTGILLMYDVHSRRSFEQLEHHLTIARRDTLAMQQNGRPVEMALLANKADDEAAEATWQVSTTEGEQWARQNGLPVTFISCRTGRNVHEAAHALAARMYEHIKHDNDGARDDNEAGREES